MWQQIINKLTWKITHAETMKEIALDRGDTDAVKVWNTQAAYLINLLIKLKIALKRKG